MSAITSHVLDTSLGKPAAAVSVSLALLEDGAFVELGRGVTDQDGREADGSFELGVPHRARTAKVRLHVQDGVADLSQRQGEAHTDGGLSLARRP